MLKVCAVSAFDNHIPVSTSMYHETHPIHTPAPLLSMSLSINTSKVWVIVEALSEHSYRIFTFKFQKLKL